MKTRLAITILALVILPTAILSFAAYRSIRGRDLILQEQLKQGAQTAMQTVSMRVDERIQDQMIHALASIKECLEQNGNVQPALVRLEDYRLIKRAYFYMNPWGFMYRGDDDLSSKEEDDSFVSAMRREIALAGASADIIKFTFNNASYCFAPLAKYKDLYVGYEIEPSEFIDQLFDTVAVLSVGSFILTAEGPGVEKKEEIVVNDPFSGSNRSVRKQKSRDDALLLADSRLPAPFDFVEIKAFIRNPDEIKRTAEIQAQLYKWMILLAAFGICAGVWIVVKASAREIQNVRSRSEFVVGVSHDLRTPIASMQMLAESLYLDRVPDKDKQKQFLGTITRECERLSQLIERVLFFVRFGQDALAYTRKEVDIGKLVESTVEAFESRYQGGFGPPRADQPAAEKAEGGDLKPEAGEMSESETTQQPDNITTVVISPSLPLVRVDETAISQVLLNLLDNAVKYGKGQMAEGGNPPRRASLKPEAEDTNPNNLTTNNPATIAVAVEAEHHRGRNCVRISVKDSGKGIERKYLRKIFGRFYRIPGSSQGNVSGVGLGLALCRHVVKAHNGWIAVDSEVGKGTTFSIYLPVK